MQIVNILNDLSVKRVWRILFRFAQFFPILNLLILLNSKKISDSVMISFWIFTILFSVVVLRIRWLYLNKIDRLQ
jgi:hypothetical protein